MRILLLITAALSSDNLRILVLKGGQFLPRVTTVVPLNGEMKMPPGHFGLLMPVNHQAQKELIILIINGKLDWHHTVEVKRRMSGTEGTQLGTSMLSGAVMSQWEMGTIHYGQDKQYHGSLRNTVCSSIKA